MHLINNDGGTMKEWFGTKVWEVLMVYAGRRNITRQVSMIAPITTSMEDAWMILKAPGFEDITEISSIYVDNSRFRFFKNLSFQPRTIGAVAQAFTTANGDAEYTKKWNDYQFNVNGYKSWGSTWLNPNPYKESFFKGWDENQQPNFSSTYNNPAGGNIEIFRSEITIIGIWKLDRVNELYQQWVADEQSHFTEWQSSTHKVGNAQGVVGSMNMRSTNFKELIVGSTA
jgi:hypothetical protein